MNDEPNAPTSGINIRRTAIVVGAVGAVLLFSNLDGPDFGINFDSDDDSPRVIKVVAGSDGSQRFEDAIEAKIERKIAGKLEATGVAALDTEIDAEMEAAVEDLKEGDPEAFLELMDKL